MNDSGRLTQYSNDPMRLDGALQMIATSTSRSKAATSEGNKERRDCGSKETSGSTALGRVVSTDELDQGSAQRLKDSGWCYARLENLVQPPRPVLCCSAARYACTLVQVLRICKISWKFSNHDFFFHSNFQLRQGDAHGLTMAQGSIPRIITDIVMSGTSG